jgi:hypothetical protein
MSPLTQVEAENLVEQIKASSDEQVKSILDLAVQNRDLGMIICVFMLPKESHQNMAVEALKQRGSEAFEDILDRVEKADDNLKVLVFGYANSSWKAFHLSNNYSS